MDPWALVAGDVSGVSGAAYLTGEAPLPNLEDGGPEGSASSLVTSGRTESPTKPTSGVSGWRGGNDSCPRRGSLRGFDEETGDMWATSCGANVCPYCIETNVWLTGKAFAHSHPTRYVVFTGLQTDDYETNRTHLKVLIKRLRRHGYEVRWFATIEENPRGTGFHLNFWWWSSCCPKGSLCRSGCRGYIPQAVLADFSADAGWGRVTDVRRWETHRAGYGLKEASGSTYGLKEAGGNREQLLDGRPRWNLTERQSSYLRRHGGRLHLASPSFWRDGDGGQPLRSKRATLEAVRAAENRPKRERSQWVMFAGSEVLASAPVSPASPASETSTVPSGTRSTAVAPSPGSRSGCDRCAPMVALTLRWSRPATNTCTLCAPTARSSPTVRASTPPLPGLWDERPETMRPPVVGSSG